MRVLIQISDLHFGIEINNVLENLVKDIDKISPALIMVSGDITQRAFKHEYNEALNFLDRLDYPKIIVPGNHDVPLFNIFKRFIDPLSDYRKYITEDMYPFYKDDEIAVMGFNSARSFTIKDGKISQEQMDRINSVMKNIKDSVFKIIVTHHPFIPAPDMEPYELIGRGKQALEMFQDCGINLILGGHLHNSFSYDIKRYYMWLDKSIIYAQAGTAISSRNKRGANAYNIITVKGNDLYVSIREYSRGRFRNKNAVKYTL
jgi:3',5'-cyclic AMP phosphodiesterase CpdA